MAQADGSIRIEAIVSDEKAKKKLDQLNIKLRRQTESVDKQAAAVEKLKDKYNSFQLSNENAISKQALAVEKLKEKYNALISGNTEPKGAKKLADELKKAEAETARLDQEYQKLREFADISKIISGAVDPQTQMQLDTLAQQLSEADAKADTLKQRLATLKGNPAATAEARHLAEEIALAESKLKQLKDSTSVNMKNMAVDISLAEEKFKRLQAEATETKSNIENISGGYTGKFEQLRAVLGNIGGKLKNGIAAGLSKSKLAAAALLTKLRGIGKSSKDMNTASRSMQRFGRRLKSIVLGALVFNVISKALRNLTEQMGKYLTANNDFAKALSGIKSNLLTAFQPIYDAVLPALTAMLEKVEQITARMAQFIASIFGTTAKQAQENAKALYKQADATEATGKAAKNAEKFLASFDTIEKAGKEENKTAPNFDTDFSTASGTGGLSSFWEAFKKSWEQYGVATIDAAKSAFQKLKDLADSLWATFKNVWTSGAGLSVLNSFQLLLQTIFGIIGDIAAAFTTAWNSGAGEAAIQSIAFKLNSVMDLLRSIGEAFREAWNDGNGVQITETLLSIIANVNNTVGELANRLREAWEANENGVAIWNVILDVVQDILDFLNEISAATLEWMKSINLEPLVTSFRNALEAVEPLVDLLLNELSWAWEKVFLPIAKWETESELPAFINSVSAALKTLTAVLQPILKTIEALWSMIEPFVSIVGNWIDKQIWGVVDFLQGLAEATQFLSEVFTWLIQQISEATNALSNFFNNALSNLGGTVKGFLFGNSPFSSDRPLSGRVAVYAPQSLSDAYPHLANGAVISPNNEFLAVLGDQRSGTNIETPLDLMEQAFMNAIQKSGIGDTSVNVNLNGNATVAQLVRQLYPQIEIERQRRGPAIGGSIL